MAQILLLEDDVKLADQMVAFLHLEDHDVAHFTDVAPAFDHACKQRVDLAICDLFLKQDAGYKRQGGLTLIAQLRQLRNKPMPILAISGALAEYGELAILTSALSVGATKSLQKPFHPDELTQTVSELLSWSNAAPDRLVHTAQI